MIRGIRGRKFDMSWPNRTACDILEEMRKCHKTTNFSYLPGLIEEMQSTANRMEAKLEDFSDIESSHERKKEAEKKAEEAEKKLRKLEEELEEKEKEK